MGSPEPPGIDSAHVERVAALVVPLLPASLAATFDARFTRSDRLFDEYVSRLTFEVMRETGIDAALASWATAEEVVARAGLDARCATVPVDWMLRRMAARGAVETDHTAERRRFRARGPMVGKEPGEIRAVQEQHDPAALPSYTLAETAARAYPGFLAGAKSGEELLLTPTRLQLWNSYFSNEHSLYTVNNRVAAVTLATWMPAGPATILELGAGMGSASTAALDALRDQERLTDVAAYRATDVVPTFLRYAERRVREQAAGVKGITFGALDMNKPLAPQGIAPGSQSIVYAVNTLHVAHDLALTLREIRDALRPGGQLIMGECVRPHEGQALYPEFVFNMLATFRHGGFLTPEQWRVGLDTAGFVDVRFLPDIVRIRDVVPEFSVAGIAATRAP